MASVVPQEAATDTETQSDCVLVEAQQPQTNQKRRVLVGFVATAALLATGAAVATTKSSTTAQWKSSAGAVSKWATFNSTGCGDWETQMISLKKVDTRAKCDEECEKTSACKYANYQPGQCQAGADGAYPGACYLFKGCAMEHNTCWDLTESGSGGGSTGSKCGTFKGNLGCGDWKTQMIGGLRKVDSRAKCDEECEKTSACKYANYQPGNCQANANGGSNCAGGACDAYPGACYLFKGCAMEHNTCWDLTEFGGCGSTTVTVTTTTTSTTDKPPPHNP
jgi:hypothetical protein